jgi:hypothetical protein
MATKQKPLELSEKDRFPDGKYEKRLVSDILIIDPNYCKLAEKQGKIKFILKYSKL